MWKKENPTEELTPEIVQEKATEAGAKTPNDAAMLMGGVQKMQGQSKHLTKKSDEDLIKIPSLGKANVAIPAMPETPETGDEWEELEPEFYGGNKIFKKRNKKTGEIKRKVVSSKRNHNMLAISIYVQYSTHY